MLAVKTNTGYQEVGFFVLQAEDADSIAEALGIVKKYLDKHGIVVKVIMTDNCKAEAEAIARVFPGQKNITRKLKTMYTFVFMDISIKCSCYCRSYPLVMRLPSWSELGAVVEHWQERLRTC